MPRKTYYLENDFGLDETKSNRMIGQDMTLAQATSLFPRMYQRMTSKGPMFLGRPLTDEEFLRLMWFDPCWGEALLQGQGGGQPIETGYLSSNNHVVVPEGTFMHAIPVEFSSGEYEFQGPGYTDVGNDSVNTKLAVYHEGWLGAPDKRHTLVSGTWGVTGSSLGYIEGTRFHNLRIDGRQDIAIALGQKFESYGILSWKTGEMSDGARIWAENYRTSGIGLYQPTPCNLGNLSAFQCVESGVRFLGAWGGTTNIALLSSDACGAMFDMVALNGEAGGCLNIGAIKNETMVASAGRSWRGQCVGVLRGQFCVNIGVISGAVGGGRLPSLFVVDDRLTNGTPQGSYLEFRVKGFNYQNVIHDVRRGHTYASPGDYQSGRYEYYTSDGALYHRNARLTPTTGQATVRVNHRVGGSGQIDMGPNATPYRHIIAGPPAFATTTYLDDAATPPPPPPPPTCTWVLGETGPWSACVNGEETRTTPYVSSLAGCTPTTPKPADVVEKRACTVTPPPPSGGTGINPAGVALIVNTQEAGSEALATAYSNARSIPATNILRLSLGTGPAATTQQVDAIRQALKATHQEVVLCFRYPYYVGVTNAPNNSGRQSLCAAVAFGVRDPGLHTVSPLYGYSGLAPLTDKGFRRVGQPLSANYIRTDADRTKPVGLSILLLAKDQSGTPRGSARAGQTAPGLTVWDNRSLSGIGNGLNPCNYISDGCWVTGRKPGTTPIVAGYQSMFQLGDPGTVVFAKGFYGDHVTSHGGNIEPGQNGLNPAGQTPLTYHLDRGASFSCGTVGEPAQTSTQFMADQFVNVTVFHPLFMGGVEVGRAAWASVKRPDRVLFAGDFLCRTFGT